MSKLFLALFLDFLLGSSTTDPFCCPRRNQVSKSSLFCPFFVLFVGWWGLFPSTTKLGRLAVGENNFLGDTLISNFLGEHCIKALRGDINVLLFDQEQGKFANFCWGKVDNGDLRRLFLALGASFSLLKKSVTLDLAGYCTPSMASASPWTNCRSTFSFKGKS